MAEVPKLTVVLRKAYGGSYLAMCSKDLGADFVYAWPTAEIAVMGAAGAANVVFRKEIQAAEDPKAARREKIQLYSEQFATPYMAASPRLRGSGHPPLGDQGAAAGGAGAADQ